MKLDELDKLIDIMNETFMPHVTEKEAESIAEMAVNTIYNETVHDAKLAGETHNYNPRYLQWKKRMLGGVIKNTISAPKMHTAFKTKRSKSNKPATSRNPKLHKAPITKNLYVGGITHNVNMALTGDLMNSLKYRSMANLNHNQMRIEIGFDDANKNDKKIEQANKLGREVLGLTDVQANKVASLFTNIKLSDIQKLIPDNLTIDLT